MTWTVLRFKRAPSLYVFVFRGHTFKADAAYGLCDTLCDALSLYLCSRSTGWCQFIEIEVIATLHAPLAWEGFSFKPLQHQLVQIAAVQRVQHHTGLTQYF